MDNSPYDPTRRPAKLTPERESELRRKAETVGSLTPAEAGEYVGITKHGIDYHRRHNHLSAHKQNENLYVYKIDDLDRLRNDPRWRKTGPKPRKGV